MADELMFIFDENGVAHEYDPTFDVTVHCKSEQESDHVLDLLNTGKRMQWIDINDTEKLPQHEKPYDITIHCKSQHEQDEAVSILRHANELKHTGVVMEPKNMADALIAFCVNRHQTDEGCVGCPFGVNNDSSTATLCGIYVPSGWNMPEDGLVWTS